MHLLASAIWGALAASLGSLIGRACIALGIGFVTYKGLDVVVGSLRNQVLSNMNSIPYDAAALLGYLWFDRAIMMILSAYVAALGMRFTAGAVKKMVLK